MKTAVRMLAVAVFFVAVAAFAANLDGDYKFSSRVKEGSPDMVGWTGTMKITGDTMVRNYKAKDGKEEKFYEAKVTNTGGDQYSLKLTKAYKPEYVGQEHKNKITIKGNELTIEGTDGKYKETWTKK